MLKMELKASSGAFILLLAIIIACGFVFVHVQVSKLLIKKCRIGMNFDHNIEIQSCYLQIKFVSYVMTFQQRFH